jgi:hypothetical protein
MSKCTERGRGKQYPTGPISRPICVPYFCMKTNILSSFEYPLLLLHVEKNE